MGSGSTAGIDPHDWAAEYAALSGRGGLSALSCEELERLADAAFLTGRDDEVITLRERAVGQYLTNGEVAKACRCVFWLGFHLENTGRSAHARGWLAKLERLVGENPERLEPLTGLLDLGRAAPLMMLGRFGEALPLFESGRARAQQHADVDAAVLGGVGAARCVEMLGRPQAAITMFDEVMVDVVASPVAPQVAGLAYCSMIDLSMRYLDIGRAREWTRALTRWCDDQSGLVPYRGSCAVHRAELLQIEGAWQRAETVALEASRNTDPAIEGRAHYRLAELLRLRGRFAESEEQFRAAARHGCEVQPGLARLRAAQGRLAAAQSGLDRVGGADNEVPALPAFLAARVEIAVLRGDLDTARVASETLADIAAAEGATSYLRGLAAHAAGSTLLAKGRPRPALADLRRAAAMWAQLDAPYEAARTRVLLADACAAVGDADAAGMERDIAREIFEMLGAAADLGTLANADHPSTAGLSAREVQVLRLLATGATNRAIADRLVLSEKTVARHVSNIFGKLGVNNRAAATAYAFQHELT